MAGLGTQCKQPQAHVAIYSNISGSVLDYACNWYVSSIWAAATNREAPGESHDSTQRPDLPCLP